MGKAKKPEYWIVDDSTYQKLQPLKRFVDFVAGLPYTTELHKRNAEEIKGLIETINQPETIKEWSVCLNIFDLEVQARKRNGIFWREWRVYLESGFLEIESANHLTDENGSTNEELSYHALIYLERKVKGDRICLNNDLHEFIDDAMNYQKYITEGLNEVEVDIDIFSNPKEEKEDKTYSAPIW